MDNNLLSMPKQVDEPLLGNMGGNIEPKKQIHDDNKSAKSALTFKTGGGHQKSEVQVTLEQFMKEFKDEVLKNKKSSEYLREEANDDYYQAQETKDDDVLKQLLDKKVTIDAVGCETIASLKDFCNEQKEWEQNKDPKQQFFDKQTQFYLNLAKEKEDNETITGIVPSNNGFNRIVNMQMEIFPTVKSQVTVLKCIETMGNDESILVKTLKFYDFESRDGKIQGQKIAADIEIDKFDKPYVQEKTLFNTQLIHYENFLFFYQRNKGATQLNLMQLDLITLKMQEVKGFTLREPGMQYENENFKIQFLPMFSQQFGNEKSFKSVADFLSNQYVFAQVYRLDYVEKQTTNYQLTHNELKAFNFERGQLTEITCEETRKQEFTHPIQNVCHHHHNDHNLNPVTTFVAFDSFYSYHFQIFSSQESYNLKRTSSTQYYGNNEYHVENEAQQIEYDRLEKLQEQQDQKVDHLIEKLNKKDSIRKDVRPDLLFLEDLEYFPFYKHHHSQFVIEKTSVTYTNKGKKHEIKDQYYILTNENQYMLVYPNYQTNSDKSMVLKCIADQFQYSQQESDESFNYQQDLDSRIRDYVSGDYRKVCHINSNESKNANVMKTTKHLSAVLSLLPADDKNTNKQSCNVLQFKPNNFHPQKILDQSVIISVNPIQTQVLIFRQSFSRIQSKQQLSDNLVLCFTFKNTLKQPENKPMKIQSQVDDLQLKIAAYYDNRCNEKKQPANNHSFYMNSIYKDVIAHTHFIKTGHMNSQNKPCHNLVPRDHQNDFFFVEDKNGQYLSIRFKKPILKEENITLQYYFKNKAFYVFFFTLTNEREKLDRKHTWFAVKKSVKDIIALSQNNSAMSLIETTKYNESFNNQGFEQQKVEAKSTSIVIFNENLDNAETPEANLQSFTSNGYTFSDLKDDWEEPRPAKLKQNAAWSPRREILQKGQDQLINLSFERVVDNKVSNIEFIPIIYQKQNDTKSHTLLMLNINTMKIVKQTSLISNLGLRANLRQTITGFAEYHLNRTSDVSEEKLGGMMDFHSCSSDQQRCNLDAKYQVTAQYYLNHIQGREELYDDLSNDSNLNPAESVLEMREFNFRYNCCGKNSIQPVSLKYLLLTLSASRHLKETFKQLQILPFIQNNGSVKGSMMAIRKNDSEYKDKFNLNTNAPIDKDDNAEQRNKKLTQHKREREKNFDEYNREKDDYTDIDNNILLLDQNFNNLYSYENKTHQYGVQRYRVNANNVNDFLIIASCQFKQKIYQGEYLDDAESYWVQSKVIKKLLSQNQAKYENYLLNDNFDLLQRDEFYKAQEVLQGRSLNDISVKSPNEVGQGLSQEEENYHNIEGSLIEEISCSDKTLIDSYLKMQLAEKHLLINMDFNFCSTLRYAAELNENQTIKLILEKIFDVNSIEYQDIFMMELPIQLKMPRIERLYDFLHRDYKEAKVIESQNQRAMLKGDKQLKSEYLNFEDFLNHPHLPPFLATKVNYLAKDNFKDFHNFEEEIIMEIVNKYPYMTWNVQNFKDEIESNKSKGVKQMKRLLNVKEEKNIEVEHSAIDFQRMIIGDKLRAIEEGDHPTKVVFNDKHLSDIFLIDNEEYIDFYNCDAVRKIIDFQYLRTKKFMLACFTVYMCGFMIPFLLTLSIKSQLGLNMLYILCMATQCLLMIQEFAQLKEQGWNYFKDIWNILDSSQFVFFTFLFLIKLASQFQSDSFPEILLQSVLLIQTFNRVFYFLRMWEQVSMIFQFCTLIIAETIPYLIMVVILMMSISMQYISLHQGINDPNGEYTQLDSNFMKLMVQMYKSNKGDVNVPMVEEQMATRIKDVPFKANTITTLNLSVWVWQQLIFILIAAVFTYKIMIAYEKHYKQMPQRIYWTKATLNCENFDIMDNFFKDRRFKVICFSFDKNLKWDVYKEWNGQVNQVENRMMIHNFEDEFDKEEQDTVIEKRQAEIVKTKETIDELYYKIHDLQKRIPEQPRKCCCDKHEGSGSLRSPTKVVNSQYDPSGAQSQYAQGEQPARKSFKEGLDQGQWKI